MRRIPGPPQYGPGTDPIGHAHPTGEIHINKLAREPGVSPGSVKSYADTFERDGLLTVTRPGTARILSLENDSFAARELKRARMPLLLVRAGTGEIAPKSISVTVYGSTAAGTFDEQSDTDIQITGDENQVDHDRVPALEIGRPLLPVGADERGGRPVCHERLAKPDARSRGSPMRWRECIDRGLIRPDTGAYSRSETPAPIPT